MLSLFAKKALPSIDGFPATKHQECHCCHGETLLTVKLQRENQQLRRELEDAHYSIRQLEAQSSNVFVLPSAGEEEDEASVEVQSVDNSISVSSSMTTIPTGSALANEARAKQQQRDYRRTQRRTRSYNRQGNRINKKNLLLRRTQHREPYGELLRTQSEMLTTLREDVPTSEDDRSLPFLWSSSISSSSGISELSGEVSSDTANEHRGLKKDNSQEVVTFAVRCLKQIDSTESEFSNAIMHNEFGEI